MKSVYNKGMCSECGLRHIRRGMWIVSHFKGWSAWSCVYGKNMVRSSFGPEYQHVLKERESARLRQEGEDSGAYLNRMAEQAEKDAA
jgi:hypothetical protein